MDEPAPAARCGRPGAGPDGTPADRRLSPGAVAFLGLGISIGLCLAVTVGAGLVLDAVDCTASPAVPAGRAGARDRGGRGHGRRAPSASTCEPARAGPEGLTVFAHFSLPNVARRGPPDRRPPPWWSAWPPWWPRVSFGYLLVGLGACIGLALGTGQLPAGRGVGRQGQRPWTSTTKRPAGRQHPRPAGHHHRDRPRPLLRLQAAGLRRARRAGRLPDHPDRQRRPLDGQGRAR